MQPLNYIRPLAFGGGLIDAELLSVTLRGSLWNSGCWRLVGIATELKRRVDTLSVTLLVCFLCDRGQSLNSPRTVRKDMLGIALMDSNLRGGCWSLGNSDGRFRALGSRNTFGEFALCSLLRGVCPEV
jgi:hypothetical protein